MIACPAVPSKAGNVKFTSAAVAVDAFKETNFPLVELSNLNSPSVPCEVVVCSFPAITGPVILSS